MNTKHRYGLIALNLLAALIVAGPASAVTIGFGGASDPSLHGATGSLTIVDQGSQHRVTWSMNFSGYVPNSTHEYLTHVAFKAFDSVSGVSVIGGYLGNLYASSNVQNTGCDSGGSPAGFVCLDLAQDVRATRGGTFSVSFLVNGHLANDEWSYRGKFGTGNGWVISESGRCAVPEPSAALLFAVGGVVFAGVRRNRA